MEDEETTILEGLIRLAPGFEKFQYSEKSNFIREMKLKEPMVHMSQHVGKVCSQQSILDGDKTFLSNELLNDKFG